MFDIFSLRKNFLAACKNLRKATVQIRRRRLLRDDTYKIRILKLNLLYTRKCTFDIVKVFRIKRVFKDSRMLLGSYKRYKCKTEEDKIHEYLRI